MNKNKRLAYCKSNDTQVGIHTGNGTTQEIVDLDKASTINLIETCNIRKVRNEDGHETYMRVNPNRNYNGYISTEYTNFKNVMQGLFDELGVSDFEWKRVDLSFNTLDNKYFANYYSGSVVKTKIQDFYNELIWLISYEEHGENSGTLPRTIYAKLHTATASLDSSIQPVSDNQVQNDAVQSYRCGYIDQWQLWLL